MSRRYGRNQRRAHRARIAELEAQVYRLSSTGPGGWRWAPSNPEFLTLPDARITRDEDKTYEGRAQRTTRSATVDVRLTQAEAVRVREEGRANWRGVCWHVVQVQIADAGRMGFEFTLNLEGVAPRDWAPADLPEHYR